MNRYSDVWLAIASAAAGALLVGYVDKPAPVVCSGVIIQHPAPESDAKRLIKERGKVYKLEGKIGDDHL